MADGKCYHHPSKDAVAICTGCGKGICKDCYDSYGAGMGAEKALCFDCTEDMVKEHTADIAAFRKKVEKERIFMIVGAIIGVIFAFLTGATDSGDVLVALIICLGCAGFGASFLFALKMIAGFFLVMGGLGFILLLIVGGVALPVLFFLGIPISIYRYIKRKNQIKQCDEIIASDSGILQEMRDYFAYTQAMENNNGVDLARLAEQGSELFENTYAQAVLSKGEQEAQAELRQSVVTISANGEIIRSFDKKPKKKAA